MSVENDLKPTIADHIHSAISVMTSVVPGGSELFNLLVDKPINARRDQWIIELEKRLRFLESHGLKINDLQNNDEFISAVLYASYIAIRNHSEEKRKALLNAITNIALKTNIDETKEKMFLNYIDDFTDWHLKILWYFENQKQRFADANKAIRLQHKAGISVYFHEFLSENKLNLELVKLILNDLNTKGLLEINQARFNSIQDTSPLATLYNDDPLKQRLTDLGREFINFIRIAE